MPEIIETTVYRLDELSDAAKEKARAWYREGGFDYDWFESVYDDFEASPKFSACASKLVSFASMAAAPGKSHASGSVASPAKATAPASKRPIPTGRAPRAGSGNMHRRMRSFTGSPTPYR